MLLLAAARVLYPFRSLNGGQICRESSSWLEQKEHVRHDDQMSPAWNWRNPSVVLANPIPAVEANLIAPLHVDYIVILHATHAIGNSNKMSKFVAGHVHFRAIERIGRALEFICRQARENYALSAQRELSMRAKWELNLDAYC